MMAAIRPNLQPPGQTNFSGNNVSSGGSGTPNIRTSTYPSYQQQSHFNNNNNNYYTNGMQYYNNAVFAPPRPPPPPQPVSFMRSHSNYSDPPLPPGISELPSSSFPPPLPQAPPPPVLNADGTFAPLNPPPLPPLFPYLSPQLAQSLHDGAKQCGTSFHVSEDSSHLHFIPVIIDDNDLKKMTESVKTQFEETTKQNLLLYEDIIDPNWPKQLREMFQALYCKLCKLTLSSPVVARDHYKGKRHIRCAELWLKENSNKFQRKPAQQYSNNSSSSNNNSGHISGTIKPLGKGTPHQQEQSFRGTGGNAAPYYQNQQHGVDRSPPPPPPPPSQNNYNNQGPGGMKRKADNFMNQQQSEFIPAYRAALAPSGPSRKRHKKEGGSGSGPNFGYCGLCNVHHTSAVTAAQHNSGRNHKAKIAIHQNGGSHASYNQ